MSMTTTILLDSLVMVLLAAAAAVVVVFATMVLLLLLLPSFLALIKVIETEDDQIEVKPATLDNEAKRIK